MRLYSPVSRRLSYTPTGTPDAVYNSDEDSSGAIKVYLEGTTVTIAGNGSGKISLNSDSRGVFAKFCGVESIEGLELLDGSLVTNLAGAFNFCHRLTEVNISAWELPNVTALAGMFADCSKLERVYLPKLGAIVVTANNIFQNCPKLREVDYFVGTHRIYPETFLNCTALKTVNGLADITVIEKRAFYGCSALEELGVPVTVEESGESVERRQLAAVINIGEEAFARCYNLKELHFGSVTKISKQAFMFCIKLEKVTGLSNLPAVEEGVFKHCIALREIQTLEKVTQVGDLAFFYTPVLTVTGLNPTIITSIGKAAFHLSSVEDGTSMDGVSLEKVGDFGTRKKRWGGDLATVQSTGSGSYQLSVPHPDSQTKYPNLAFATVYMSGTQTEDNSGEETVTAPVPDMVLSVADYACVALSLYHMAQVLGENTFVNFGDWYTEKLGGAGFAWNNHMAQIAKNICENYLGWTRGSNYNAYYEGIKERIIADLQTGKPTMISINTHMVGSSSDAFHAVAVIGYDRVCDKFTIVDSGMPGTDGVVARLAFEDLFTKADPTALNQNCIMEVIFLEQEEQQAE